MVSRLTEAEEFNALYMSARDRAAKWKGHAEELQARAEEAERELGDMRDSRFTWKARAERADASIERIEELAKRMRAKGRKNVASYWFRIADEIEAVLKEVKP